MLERKGLPLVKGRRYLLQFRARADAPQTIHALSQVDVHAAGASAQDQGGLLGGAQYHSGLDEFLWLTPQWQAFRLSWQPGREAPEGTSSLALEVGQQANTLRFADMMLVPEKDAVSLPGEIARRPVPIRASAGVFQLAAVDARTHGDMHYEPGAVLDDLGWWSNPADWAEWSVQTAKPGKFHVTALVAAMGTGIFTVAVGNQSVTGTVPNTGSYFTYQSVDLGMLAITQTGRVSVSLRPVADGWHAMNLKSLTLTPVP